MKVSAHTQSILPVNDELLGISLRGAWSKIYHQPSFGTLPGLVDCGTYIRGNGTTYGLSATIEHPVGSQFYGGIGVIYLTRGGTLTTANDSEPAFDSTTGSVVDVVTENALETQLSYLELSPQLWWIPITLGRSSFRVSGSIRVGIPLTASAQQTRRILSPDNAVFISNQQRTINWTNGYQPLTNLRRPVWGISLGMEHLLPIGKRLHLLQQIAYDYNLQSPLKNTDWIISGLRLEVGIRYSIPAPEKTEHVPTPQPQLPPTDTVQPQLPVPTPLPVPTVDLRIVDVEGTIEEGTELIASTPLVTAVFFEQNSSVLPSRYIRRFHDSIASNDPVTAHRNVLVNLATLLGRNPTASLVLDGAVAGEFENNDTALARARAEAVAEALVELGIEPSRMRIRASRLPRIPSNMDYPEGREENQRVDITVVNAPLLEYVSKQTFAQFRGMVHLHVGGSNIENAEIHLRLRGGEERTLSDTGRIALPVLMRLNAHDTSTVIVAEAFITGTSTLARAEHTLSLQQVPRKRVELSTLRFEAFLRFDYNSSVLSTENRQLLEQLIERLTPGTTVEIGGSADILGDVARNRKLAEERARSTAEFISTLGAAKQLRIIARSIERPFSDASPEGRFLNRSIRVRLPQTP